MKVAIVAPRGMAKPHPYSSFVIMNSLSQLSQKRCLASGIKTPISHSGQTTSPPRANTIDSYSIQSCMAQADVCVGLSFTNEISRLWLLLCKEPVRVVFKPVTESGHEKAKVTAPTSHLALPHFSPSARSTLTVSRLIDFKRSRTNSGSLNVNPTNTSSSVVTRLTDSPLFGVRPSNN